MSDKKYLGESITVAYKYCHTHYEFVPRTFLIPRDRQDLITDMENTALENRFYIVKPRAGLQGDGIFIVRSIQELDSSHANISDCVIQKYISNPLLINQ